MDRGKIDAAQPDVGRVGGLSEAKIVCDLAAERERIIVPHCWKTGVSVSATAHLAFVTPHCPFMEYLPPELCEDILRRELVAEELGLVDGTIPQPRQPGSTGTSSVAPRWREAPGDPASDLALG